VPVDRREGVTGKDFNEHAVAWSKFLVEGPGFSLPGWDSRASSLKLALLTGLPCRELAVHAATACRHRDI
jgi:hypothetical protein